MLTLDRPQDAISKQSGVARSVRVRVRPDGPVVDLPLGKTTVGSSPRCNIRIQQPGVQPLHCLILNEADGLTVRRWAGETVLNGRTVEESAIDAGDCLRVGPAELEIIDPQAATPVAPQRIVPLLLALPVTPVPNSLTPVLAAPASALEPEQEGPSQDRVGRELARLRSRQLLAALRERRDSGRELQQRLAQLEIELESAASDREDFAGQLEGLTSELAEAQRKAADQQKSAAAYQEMAGQNEQLGREVCTMIERIEQLTSEAATSSASWRAAVDEKEALASESRRLSDENSRLLEKIEQQANCAVELSAERDEVQGQCDALRTELAAVAEREAALTSRAENRERELASLQQQVVELANQRHAACEERDQAWRQCESLRSNIHGLSERESSLAQNVARLEQEIAQQQYQCTDLSNQIAGLSAQRDDASQQCESLRAELLPLREREVQLTENVSRLEHEIGQYRLQSGDLSHQIAALTGERDDARQQCDLLRTEIETLTEREAGLSENVRRLEREDANRISENTGLSSQIGALRAEYDDLRDQNEQLRSQVSSLAQERAALTEDHAATNRECESLRLRLQEGADQEARRSEQLAELTAECQRLRDASDRLPQLEQQVRDVIADRENTSSELYRALLQLAEVQERDDQNVALQAAHRALNAELEKSMKDIAELQTQIDRLNESRLAADEARQSLDRRTAELIEAHQQLAYDKSTLNAEIAELREKLEIAAEREQEARKCVQEARERVQEARERAEEARRGEEEAREREVEARKSEEVAREREAEHAAKLASSAADRQRLTETQQELAELTEMVARLQCEVEAKECLAASAAAEISDRDRQLSEYSEQIAQLSEAVRLLESRSAASIYAEAQLEQERDEWRAFREEAAQQESQLLQRVTALESELADAQVAAELAAELIEDQVRRLADAERLAAASAAWSRKNNDTSEALETSGSTAVESEADFGSPSAAADSGPSPEFEWPANRDATKSESDVDPFGETAPEALVDAEWTQASEESPTPLLAGDEVVSESNDAWRLGESEKSTGEWSRNSSVAEPTGREADESWKRVEAGSGAGNELPEVEAPVPSKVEPTSFIERYSHMFANDSLAEEPQPAPAAKMPPVRDEETRRSSGGARSTGGRSPASDDNEESIEEYMAKLLQRVRGESPVPPAAATTPQPPAGERTLPMTAPTNFASGPLTAPPNAGDLTSPMGFDPAKRRSSLPAPQTDLEALRALANESARRAISRHAVRKHRRNATTKVIVAALAGVTSLWLMLDSDSWFNLQFITACVSMLVAAYWASETFRALLETYRVAVSDETDEEIEELSAKLRSPLPIDVE